MAMTETAKYPSNIHSRYSGNDNRARKYYFPVILVSRYSHWFWPVRYKHQYVWRSGEAFAEVDGSAFSLLPFHYQWCGPVRWALAAISDQKVTLKTEAMYLQGRSEEQEEPDSTVTLEPPDHI